MSLGTTFKDELAKAGVIFCSISEAIREHPELVKKYLGSVVPQSDNFFATLNSAVFSDGSFVYIPPKTRCPMELSTYFRINAENTGQFERTLIIADKGSYVSYLEGCTAPKRDIAQLHAAVVEIVILEDAEVKYSTVQNWYPGDEERQGRDLQLRHQAGRLPRRPRQGDVDPGRDRRGDHLEIPVLHPARRRIARRVLLDRDRQQHAAGRYRHQDDPSGQEHPLAHCVEGDFGRQGAEHLSWFGQHAPASAANGRNYTQCDSLLIGDQCGAHTVPYIEVKNNSSRVEHEATTSKVDDDQLFYCRSRGMDEEEAVALVVNGFCREVLQALPMEFAMEAQSLVAISLEGSVG